MIPYSATLYKKLFIDHPCDVDEVLLVFMFLFIPTWTEDGDLAYRAKPSIGVLMNSAKKPNFLLRVWKRGGEYELYLVIRSRSKQLRCAPGPTGGNI